GTLVNDVGRALVQLQDQLVPGPVEGGTHVNVRPGLTHDGRQLVQLEVDLSGKLDLLVIDRLQGDPHKVRAAQETDQVGGARGQGARDVGPGGPTHVEELDLRGTGDEAHPGFRLDLQRQFRVEAHPEFRVPPGRRRTRNAE